MPRLAQVHAHPRMPVKIACKRGEGPLHEVDQLRVQLDGVDAISIEAQGE